MKRAKTISEYLKGVPAGHRKALQTMRKRIKEAVPEAEEKIAWSIMAFKYKDKYVAGIAAYKNHCSFAPFSSLSKLINDKELEKYERTEGIIHFTNEKMLPASLVRKLLKAKIKMIEAGKARM
jgi:uncharacterized protein YdhG (YjbR/CyaY superfamily)